MRTGISGTYIPYKAGAETRPDSPAGFGNFIRDEKARRAKVVKDSGVKFD
jgi:hypothetical protein